MTSGQQELIGDNKEFAVATAGEEVKIHFQNNPDNDSSDDTATDVYLDRNGRVKRFQLRNDQAIQVLEMNDTAFTDPISIPKNAGMIERHDTLSIASIKIKTSIANTNIKVRVI